MVSMAIPPSNHYATVSPWHTHRLVDFAVTESNRAANFVSPFTRGPRSLKIGFVPLADCAPLVMAHELGLFRQFGLRVMLQRELGWATVRDKILYGELDAAHALAAMPLAASLGIGSIRSECLTALVLSLNGNAITLSTDLWRCNVRDARSLREEIQRKRHHKTFTFGVVSAVSSHIYLLRKWLSSGGIHPDRDVRIVVVPPPQMVSNLKAGHLDGFCVGEPWNSVAVGSGAGWCAVASAELEPGHPEKVLMVRRSFAEKNPDVHAALIAALIEACAFCDSPANRHQLIETLSRPGYVGVSQKALARGFDGTFDFGNGNIRAVRNFSVFHRDAANEPSGEKAAWVFQMIRTSGLCKNPSTLDFALGRKVFRSDIYEQAVRLRSSTLKKNENQTSSETVLAVA